MIFARVMLGVSSLMFLGFGLAFLFRPVETAKLVDIPLPQPTGRIEIRAFYGGLEIALALFLGLCAVRSGWITPGLVMAVLASAGPAAGRIVGLLVDRKPRSVVFTILAVELVLALVTAVALGLHLRSPSSAPS